MLDSTNEKVALKVPAAMDPVHVTFADVAHVASDTGTLPEVAEISCIVNRNGFSDTMTQTCITVPGAGTYVAVKELLFTTSISEKVSDWPAPAAVYVCPPTVTVPPICVVVQLSALIVVFICQEVVTPPGMHTGAGLPASVPAAVDRTTASACRIENTESISYRSKSFYSRNSKAWHIIRVVARSAPCRVPRHAKGNCSCMQTPDTVTT